MFFDDVRYAYRRKKLDHQRATAAYRKAFDPYGFFDSALKQLDVAIPFAVNNVARFVERASAGATEDQPKDLAHLFPCVAPLGPVCWFEFEERYDDHGDQEITDNGVLFIAHDFQDPVVVRSLEYATGIIKESGLREPLTLHTDGHRWMYQAVIFTKDRANRIAAHMCTATLRVYEDGTPGPDLISGYSNPDITVRIRPEALADYWAAYITVLHVVLASVAFSHCRNVKTVDHIPSAGEQKHAAVMGRPPVLTYKTLEIDPNHAVVKHEQAVADRSGAQPKALHIVRGHFALYTAEKPLFGNPTNVGRFFVPMHARGTLKAGRVVKDYEVLSKKEDA